MAPNKCLNKKKRNFEFVEFLIAKFLWEGLLSSRLETRLIYRYLSNTPEGRGGGGGLMRDIRNRKVPSNSLNLLSDITSIHSYSTRSSSIKYLLY